MLLWNVLGDKEDLELVEHLLVKNRSKCFDMKQIAEETSNAYYECARIKAIVKENVRKTGCQYRTKAKIGQSPGRMLPTGTTAKITARQ